MTNETQNSDIQVHKLTIDETYKQKAIDQVKTMVTGNNFNPEDVKLEKFEGEILHFQAENMLTILTKTSHKKVAGRAEGPIVVANEAAAKEAMTKAYLSLSKDRDLERKIRDFILKREDGGFAIDNNKIALPFWKKEFVFFEQCLTCNETGTVKCLPCAGKGIDQCPRCNGLGTRNCNHCNGARTVLGPNGGQVSCPTCNGMGETSCTSCNQSGRIKCKTCRSKGVTTCPSCQGKVWTSNIEILEIEARTAFDYPRDKLPEKVVAMIEKHGAKIREHADIKISQAEFSSVNLDDQEKAKRHADADKNKDYRIPIIYEVFLPYGHVEFNINDKSYYTFLFGTKGRLTHVSPFLDDLLKKGIRKLHDGANSRGDVTKNLKQAAKYRTIKEAITYTATHSLSKAKKMLKKTNKIGLSDASIKDMIIQSDIALKNITRKPRNIGLALAGLFSLASFSAYFILPVRSALTSYLPNQNLHIICDIAALLAITYIGIIIIQATAHSSIKKAMKALGINKSAPPKLGDKLYWNIGICFIIFTVMLETSRQINANTPDWYIKLLSYII